MQQGRRVVGSLQCQIEHQAQQQKQQGQTQCPAGDGLIPGAAPGQTGGADHRFPAQGPGPAGTGGGFRFFGGLYKGYRPGSRGKGKGYGGLQHLLHPVAAAGAGPHHRYAQQRRKPGQIQGDAMLFCFIQQVHHHHYPGKQGHDLQGQGQCTLQTAAVAENDHNIRFVGKDKFPGNALFFGHGRQGICTGGIHQCDLPAVQPGGAPGAGYGLARPVSGVLAQPGQGVEQGAFAHVGVARQPQHQGSGGGIGSFHRGFTSTAAASFSRRAMTVPRIP